MDPVTRRAVAYLAARLITRRPLDGLFDHGEKRPYRYTGSTDPQAIEFTDHADGHRITGSGDGMSFSIVHRGTAAICTIDLAGDTFKGFEFQCRHHFNGRLQGAELMLFDAEPAEAFYYRLEDRLADS